MSLDNSLNPTHHRMLIVSLLHVVLRSYMPYYIIIFYDCQEKIVICAQDVHIIMRDEFQEKWYQYHRYHLHINSDIDRIHDCNSTHHSCNEFISRG